MVWLVVESGVWNPSICHHHTLCEFSLDLCIYNVYVMYNRKDTGPLLSFLITVKEIFVETEYIKQTELLNIYYLLFTIFKHRNPLQTYTVYAFQIGYQSHGNKRSDSVYSIYL